MSSPGNTAQRQENRSLLVLTGSVGDGGAGAGAGDAFELLHSPPPAEYTRDEQRLSMHVQGALDRMIAGGCDQLVLLKLYPRQDAEHPPVLSTAPPGDQPGDQPARARHAQLEQPERHMVQPGWPSLHADVVRPATILHLAAGAITFFGPVHGGIVTQTAFPDVIVQGRRFTTAYPHINLERYDVYEAQTREPVLGAWRARRIQNQRRETRTNRMIDIALLALEVSQAVFPRLLG